MSKFKVNKFCSCGKVIPADAKSSCKKRVRTQEQEERHNELTKSKWKKFRKKVVNRDNGYCQRCYILNDYLETRSLQVHHIKPRVNYPELMYEATNFVTLCAKCNHGLGTSEELDFDFEPQDFEVNLVL